MLRIGHVLVISLLRRADRREAFDRRWQAATGGAPYTVLAAADRPDDPARGCYESHVQALRACTPATLVLEDDAAFAPSFSLDLPDAPADWQLLRLGGLLRTGGPPRGGWAPVVRIQHTHAYVARDPALLLRRVQAISRADIGVALSAGIGGHYRLTPGTVGQAAGLSDIAGQVRPHDQFWEA